MILPNNSEQYDVQPMFRRMHLSIDLPLPHLHVYRLCPQECVEPKLGQADSASAIFPARPSQRRVEVVAVVQIDCTGFEASELTYTDSTRPSIIQYLALIRPDSLS
jgi:hypothetical protein